MTALPKTTPQLTKEIEHCIVRCKDGSVVKIESLEGQGFYRESVLIIGDARLVTHEVFITDGKHREIQSGNR
jgi:hypothetical protein